MSSSHSTDSQAGTSKFLQRISDRLLINQLESSEARTKNQVHHPLNLEIWACISGPNGEAPSTCSGNVRDEFKKGKVPCKWDGTEVGEVETSVIRGGLAVLLAGLLSHSLKF